MLQSSILTLCCRAAFSRYVAEQHSHVMLQSSILMLCCTAQHSHARQALVWAKLLCSFNVSIYGS
jgi:hypothetical protein